MSDYLQNVANTINYKYTSNLGWFQFGGISSGLDTASIIDKILEMESQPLQRLNIKYEKLSLKREALQEVDKKLEELRDVVFELKLQANLIKLTSESSNEAVLSANATPTAVEGTYYIKVNQLASSTTLQGSQIFADPSDNINGTTLVSDLTYYTTPTDSVIRIYNIATGDFQEVSISTTDTIDDVVTKINTALDTLFGAGSGAASYDSTADKLTIATNDPNKTFVITQVSGNFMDVFHLNEVSPTGNSITSTKPVWILNENKTISDIASYTGAAVSDGTITINGVQISISTTDTIEDVVDKITSSDAGVLAYFDSSQNRIILVNKDTGNKALTVENDPTGIASVLGLVGNSFGTPSLTAGQDAVIQLSTDGVYYTTITSSTNENINVNGIEITLKNTSSTPVIVKVKKDVEAIKENIKNFVDKWNEVVGYIYDKLNEDPVKNKDWDEMSDEEKMKGILKNDEYLRGLFERLKRFMTTSFNPSGNIHYLFELGISSGDIGAAYENMMKGHLEIDEDKLEDIINNNLEDFWQFFAGTEESFFPKLHSFLWDLTKFNGEIDSVAGINGRLYREQRYLQTQIADWIRRLQKREEELWRKFSYMEEVLSRLQAQGAWLSNAIAGMTKK